jgi:hypothetical protein
VRKRWNDAALRKHRQRTGHQLFICRAEDTTKQRRELTLDERYAVVVRGKSEQGRTRRKDLLMKIEMAVGVKVMVTSNVETDLDIANGARGEIVDIILKNPQLEMALWWS